MKKIFLIFAFFISSILAFAADKPSFPGGEAALKEYLDKNVNYPAVALDNGVEGIVVVGIIITPDGAITNPKVLKFIDPELEKEALRVVNGMPAWIPAEKDGSPIEAPAEVSVSFLLPD